MDISCACVMEVVNHVMPCVLVVLLCMKASCMDVSSDRQKMHSSFSLILAFMLLFSFVYASVHLLLELE